MSTKTEENKNYCSFCMLGEDEVATLIQGPKVWICNSCVEQCVDILKGDKNYYPIPDKTVEIDIPSQETTIGDLRAALSKHHYNTKIKVRLV